MKMRKITSFFLFALLLSSFTAQQALATPSPNLHVIVIDPGAGGLGTGGLTYITSPIDHTVFSIDNEGVIDDTEHIVVSNGDVYVANFAKISRINLDSAGLPEPSSGNNVDDITGDIFSSLLAITVNNNGILYVADDDNQIYTIDPSGAPSASSSPVSIDHTFEGILDITIDNNTLYILDQAADSFNGEIYKIDISAPSGPYHAELVYAGSSDESLGNANGMAALGNYVYITGEFSFGPGVLRIDINTSTAEQFSDNSLGELTLPYGITVDPTGQDLYVSNLPGTVTGIPAIYRLSLTSIPSTPIFAAGENMVTPSGLAILVPQGSADNVVLGITKTVNATSVSPGQGLLYTITVTNTGQDTATSVKIRDFFPNTGTGQVESVEKQPGQLSFTAEVHDGSGTHQAGDCVRLGDQFTVFCDGFGPLNSGDYVVVTLEGKVNPGSTGTLVNTATVENFGFSAQDTAVTDVTQAPIVFSTVSKTTSLGPVTAGDGFIDYAIKVDNNALNTANAHNVWLNDTLPTGASSVSITSQPLPNLCQILPNLSNPNQIKCGPYTINNNNSVEINYRVVIGSNAQDPFTNSLNVSCSECASIQSASTTTQIHKESDLSIEKQVDTNSAIAGQDLLSYTLTVTNNGPSDASNVMVTDNLPGGVTFNAGGSSPECSYNSQNNTVVCNVGTIAAGGSLELTINVSVNPDTIGSLDNTASVSSDNTDPNSSNNQATSNSVDVSALADVTVSKTVLTQNVLAGGKITYSINITNTGPSAATNVQTHDVLPIGLSLIPASPNSQTDASCFNDFGTVVCNFGNIAPGITVTKSIQAQIALTVTGSITNAVEVFTDTDESNPDNNISSITTPVQPPFCGRAESDFAHVITGTAGNDILIGTNDDDLILGLGGNDKIHGKRGNDCIIGGDGDDKIWGGQGNDTIEGNAGNDEIHGQQGDDMLKGGDGDDKIWGGQGNDTIDAGNGNNQLHGNQDDDNITSGNGNDKIWGGQGSDIIVAGDGNNRINGNQDDDNITTGNGNDWINGGQGNDIIVAGDGNNRINGSQGNDNITSGNGNDWISGGDGNDVVYAGSGNDKLFGKQGNDSLFGESGDDIISGDQGNDLLNGGLNNDQCDGGKGTNTFVSCEIQKPVANENDDDEDAEDNEGDEDNDVNNNNDHGNDNNGNHGNDNNGNHGNDSGNNDKDNKDKKN